MTGAHRLATSTHTVEMAQVVELNARLAVRPGPTATSLGVGGAPLEHAPGLLPDDAVIVEVTWSGPPDFPDVHAVFAHGSGSGRLLVGLHTEALRELSHRLGLQQAWGVGSSRPAPRS